MMKSFPRRPARDFRITSVESLIAIEANHRRAGFVEVKYEVIRRRFWQLLDSLARHGYLPGQRQVSVEQVDQRTELMNYDLNDEGYAFVQRCLDKWLDRLYKDKGAETEWSFQEKWHSQFIAERANALLVKKVAPQ